MHSNELLEMTIEKVVFILYLIDFSARSFIWILKDLLN